MENQALSPVLVIDVLNGTPAHEAQAILAEPYALGYHIHRALDGPDRARVIFVRSESKERALPTQEAIEARVLALYQAKPRISANQARCVLGSEGMRAGSDRVTAALVKAKMTHKGVR